jgi:hypothetical protein
MNTEQLRLLERKAKTAWTSKENYEKIKQTTTQLFR